MKQHNFFWATFVLVLLIPITLAATFDLERVNYPDTVINVTFNDPVTFIDATNSLVFIGVTPSLPVLHTFSSTGPSPIRMYDILPTGPLSQGGHVLNIIAENKNGDTNSPAIATFEFSGLQIKLADPVSGYSTNNRYRVTVQTYILNKTLSGDKEVPFNAECKYAIGLKPPPVFTDSSWIVLTPNNLYTNDVKQHLGGSGINLGTTHTTNTLSTSSTKIHILCQQYSKGVYVPSLQLANASFDIGYENTPPTITVTANPSSLTDFNNPRSEITVTTDQKTMCKIAKGSDPNLPRFPFQRSTTFNETHGHIISYDQGGEVNTDYSTSLTPHAEKYTIYCTNQAGISHHETVDIAVHFKQRVTIAVIEPPTSNPTNKTPVILNITTDMPATCTVNDTTSGQTQMTSYEGGYTHRADYSPTGLYNPYTVEFNCTSGDKNGKKIHSFHTDRVPPVTTITPKAIICDGNANMTLSAKNSSGDADPGIAKYVWELLDSTGNQVSGGSGETTTGGEISVSVASTATQLTWRAYAIDTAGNTGVTREEIVDVFPGDSDNCNSGIHFIDYGVPTLGWDTTTFTPTITTRRAASCGYLRLSTNTDITDRHRDIISGRSADGKSHALPQVTLPNTPIKYHLNCTDESPIQKSYTRELDFGINTGALSTTYVLATPNPVIDFNNPTTIITAVTNHSAVCEFDGVPFSGEELGNDVTYRKDHIYNLDIMSLGDFGFSTSTIPYSILCTDRTALTNVTSLTVIVNFGQAFPIEIRSPSQYVNDTAINLTAKPARDAICLYKLSGGTYTTMDDGTAGERTKPLGNLAEGEYTYVVQCTTTSSAISVNTTTFFVDRTPPVVTLTSVPSSVCSNSQISISFTSDRFDDVDVKNDLINKEIRVGVGLTGTFTPISDNEDFYILSGETHGLGNLNVTLIGTDRAGNPFSANVTVPSLPLTDSSCNGPPPVNLCGNNIIDPGEVCDGALLGGKTICSNINPTLSGPLSCDADCNAYNVTQCEPPFINYHVPPLGWSTSQFTIQVRTERQATCGYLRDTPGVVLNNYFSASSSDGLIHTLPLVSNLGPVNYHVNCTETASPDTTHYRKLNFGRQGGPLVLTELLANPNPITDFQMKETLIGVTTSNEAVCSLSLVHSVPASAVSTAVVPFDTEIAAIPSTYKLNHEYSLDLSAINSLDAHTLTYSITCTDKSGQSNSEDLVVDVHYGQEFTIDILSPSQQVSDDDVVLAVKPSTPATCQYIIPATNTSQSLETFNTFDPGTGIFRTSLGNLAEGLHSARIQCINALDITSTTSITFTVDRTPPIVSLITSTNVCENRETSVVFSSSDTLVNKKMKVGVGLSGIPVDILDEDVYFVLKADDYPLGVLNITGTGADPAGNSFSANTALTSLPSADAICTGPFPTCGNGALDTGEYCDGTIGVPKACSEHDVTLTGTIASCTDSCIYDLSTCTAVITNCGNAVLDTDEQCDDSLLGTDTTCSDYSINLTGTVTACTALCRYDLDTCANTGGPVYGCMNESASNYNVRNTIDDGSCEFNATNITGCIDPLAANYNPDIRNGDNSCEYDGSNNPVWGCMDPKASNYNARVTNSDRSCKYDFNTIVEDCNDPTASNYNPRATENDGSCVYDNSSIVYDCTDPKASNYNPLATRYDNSCTYNETTVVSDCTDPKARNYNPRATQESGTCAYNDVLAGPGPGGSPPETNTPDMTSSDPNDNYSEPENGFSWLAIILLLMGVLTMGGASYYLYDTNQERPQPMTQQPITPPPVSRESTVQLLKRRQEEHEAFKEHAEHSTKQRHKLTKTFGEVDNSQQKLHPKNSQSNQSESVQPEPSKEVSESTQKKKSSDVFERLDEFIDEVKEEKK